MKRKWMDYFLIVEENEKDDRTLQIELTDRLFWAWCGLTLFALAILGSMVLGNYLWIVPYYFLQHQSISLLVATLLIHIVLAGYPYATYKLVKKYRERDATQLFYNAHLIIVLVIGSCICAHLIRVMLQLGGVIEGHTLLAIYETSQLFSAAQFTLVLAFYIAIFRKLNRL